MEKKKYIYRESRMRRFLCASLFAGGVAVFVMLESPYPSRYVRTYTRAVQARKRKHDVKKGEFFHVAF